MKKVALSEVKDDLSRLLRIAEKEEVVITRHGKPAGVLIGFKSEDDWFEYRLETDPRFLKRIAAARKSLATGEGVRLEQLAEPNQIRIGVVRRPVAGQRARSAGRTRQSEKG